MFYNLIVKFVYRSYFQVSVDTTKYFLSSIQFAGKRKWEVITHELTIICQQQLAGHVTHIGPMVSAQDSMTKRSSRGLAKFFKRDGGGGGRGERVLHCNKQRVLTSFHPLNIAYLLEKKGGGLSRQPPEFQLLLDNMSLVTLIKIVT